MLSNRESARRSRVRHLDDLAARENALGLRTQAAELAARLHSLNDILACMNANAAGLLPGDVPALLAS
jgi:hypothetical protein